MAGVCLIVGLGNSAATTYLPTTDKPVPQIVPVSISTPAPTPNKAPKAAVGKLMPPRLDMTFGASNFEFRWLAVTDATHYRLYENPDGISGYTQVGDDIVAGDANQFALPVAMGSQNWDNASYLLEACNRWTCESSNQINTRDVLLQAAGYF